MVYTHMATLENIVESQACITGNVIGSLKMAYSCAKTTFNYSLLMGAGLASYTISGYAGPVTASAMMLGKVLLNFKKKIKTEWSKLFKEGWKGLILGNMAKMFYQNVISAIPNKEIYGKIGRALAYNPGFMGFIYNPIYLKSAKILDNRPAQDGEWKNLTKRIFKYNFAPHFITTNYMTDVQQQVAASAFLGTAYRVIAG